MVSRPTLSLSSLLCKRRRKLSLLWWVCPFFIRALNISIFGGDGREVHVFMFHKKKKKNNNNKIVCSSCYVLKCEMRWHITYTLYYYYILPTSQNKVKKYPHSLPRVNFHIDETNNNFFFQKKIKIHFYNLTLLNFPWSIMIFVSWWRVKLLRVSSLW